MEIVRIGDSRITSPLILPVERRRTQRNSIADLAQMYKAQLSNLWSTVEGSQKYVPLAPGRHLVFETHAFVELNAATYKAKQNVSMFLLNDLLLIAGRRRMKAGTPGSNGANERNRERDRGRMVAERCWVLAELVVVDVKDSGGGSRDRTTRHAILIGRSDQCVEDQARERSLRISNRSTRGQKGVAGRLQAGLAGARREETQGKRKGATKAKEHVAGRGENGLRARLGTTSADFRMALHLR